MFSFRTADHPEQWPEERRADDARLMAEGGFNVAHLAECSWLKIEPRESQCDFD